MKDLTVSCCVVGYVATNCYLAKNKRTDEILIIDPGAQAQDLIQSIDRLGGAPKGIVLTHGHFDHILAVHELKAQYAIPVYACVQEEDMLADPGRNMTAQFGKGISIAADYLLKDQERVRLASFSVQCLHTPGHTPGSCCYYLEEEGVLFSGDTLFRCSVGRTDFPGGSTRQITQSLHALLTQLPEETEVFPGHDAATTIGYEKRYNPFA